MGRISGLRVLSPYTPSAEDLVCAQGLARNDCPRRYCWWWHSLAFDWETPIAQGCTFLIQTKPPGYRSPDVPCSRCMPSGVDHYEPREPHLREDGFNEDAFVVSESGQ
jgi:hypothetical protein